MATPNTYPNTKQIEGAAIDEDNHETHLSSFKKYSSLRKVAALACLSLVGLVSVDGPARTGNSKEAAAIERIENSSSSNWAGFEAPNPGSFNFIQEKFIDVPTLDCPASGDYDASVWVGLGKGTVSDVLYQTGIGMACHDGTTSYRAWWEDFPTETEQSFTSSGTINAGDKIEETVSINQYGVEFHVQDYGASGSSLQWTDIKQLYVSPSTISQAECITERPGLGGGGYELLSDFGTLNITSDEGCDLVAGATNHIISSSAPHISGVIEYDMYNGTTLLANTSSPISSGAYTETWYASN